LPVATLNKKPDICAGESRLLTAGNFTSYAWNTGATTRSIPVSAIGTYVVTVTDANGCKGRDTAAITIINPLPKDFLPADTSICSYGTLEIKPVASFNRYEWSTGSMASTITINKPGTYWLDVTDVKACKGRDSLVVNPQDCMNGFYAPTAFTPNGDNKNDVFKPFVFGSVKQYQFTIFNRWGEVVFRSTELQKGWDGKNKTLPMPSGVFVWTCTYQLDGETVKQEKGTVVLIR
jgi:gliding motility-associated-like protein